MNKWFRKNWVDHVAQHWTYEVKHVQQQGLLDFDQSKGLVKEEDLQANILERVRTKKRKWYHLTYDAFINFLYEVRYFYYKTLSICHILSDKKFNSFLSLKREISAVLEEAIRGYKDTLIRGFREDRRGRPLPLKQLKYWRLCFPQIWSIGLSP